MFLCQVLVPLLKLNAAELHTSQFEWYALKQGVVRRTGVIYGTGVLCEDLGYSMQGLGLYYARIMQRVELYYAGNWVILCRDWGYIMRGL